jgi:hypothetical protein
MRWRLTASAMVLACACSSEPPQGTNDAGPDRMGIDNRDGAIPGPDASTRLAPHSGIKLPAIQLGIIYVGDVDAGGAPSDDPSISWLIGSPYWLLLSEYGIANGALVGVARVPQATFFHGGDVGSNGLVDVLVLEARIVQALHDDADASTTSTVSIPFAQAYLVYLPDGVNVALGHRGNYTYQTCIDANGYHGYDGFEPYTVLPPCPDGRTMYAAAHELMEMATDPQPYKGWASDSDIPMNGGEVADLCAQKVMQEGVIVTRLWSNQSGGCVP